MNLCIKSIFIRPCLTSALQHDLVLDPMFYPFNYSKSKTTPWHASRNLVMHKSGPELTRSLQLNENFAWPPARSTVAMIPLMKNEVNPSCTSTD